MEKNSAESESLKNKLSGLERLYRSRKEDFDGAKENFEKNLYELKSAQRQSDFSPDNVGQGIRTTGKRR